MPETNVDVRLFSSFSNEFWNSHAESQHGVPVAPLAPLAPLARLKGRWIATALERMSDAIDHLVCTCDWNCYWDGHVLYFSSSHSLTESADHLNRMAVPHNWYNVTTSADGHRAHTSNRPVPSDILNELAEICDVHGVEGLFGHLEVYEPRSVVLVDALYDFEGELLLSGVGHEGDSSFGEHLRPEIEWPDDNFDLAAHVRNLGYDIKQRLERIAALDEAIAMEFSPWGWCPNSNHLVYVSPLSLPAAREFLEQQEFPMERVWIDTPQRYRRRNGLA